MRTQQNFDYKKHGEPKTELPSKTVPSQVLPLRTLVERYMRGQSVETFGGTYSEDESFADLDRLDATERLDYLREQVKPAIERGRQTLAKKERERQGASATAKSVSEPPEG